MKVLRIFLHISLIVILIISPISHSTIAYGEESTREVDFGNPVTFNGSTNIDMGNGMSFYLKWDLDPKVTCSKNPSNSFYSLKFDFGNKDILTSKYTGVKTEDPPILEIEPLFEWDSPIDDSVQKTTLNSKPDVAYLKGEEYLELTGYGDKDISGYTYSGYLPVFQDTTEKFNLIKPLVMNISKEEHAKKVLKDFAGWLITTSSWTNLYSPDEVSKIYGYADVNLVFNGNSLSQYILIDPLTSGRYEAEESPDDLILSYQPHFDCEPVDLRISNNVDWLFTTQSYSSMKAFCSVMAANENNKLEKWLKELGFTNYERFNTGNDLLGSDATGWFAFKKMSDGRNLVFTFVQGTDGDVQWASNFDADILAGLFGAETNHHGFEKAADKVGREMVLFADKCGADPTNTFFSFCGYSRGAGIVDILASQPTIPTTSTPLNKSNCLAYTFEAPNTRNSTPDAKIPYVINVVDGNDIVTHVPPGWHKNGVVLGYTHDQNIIKSFYNTDNINDPAIYGAHLSDNVIANVFSYKPTNEWDTAKYGHTQVHCPTDVTIIKNDQVVASVVDNVITNKDSNIVIFTNDAGEKDIITPYNEGYRVVVEATGDGVMNVAFNLLGDKAAKVNKPTAYDITKGQIYEIDQNTGEVKLENGSFFGTVPIIIGLGIIILIIIIIAVKTSKKRRKVKQETSNFLD